MKFTYAIKYVGNMDDAVRFHQDTLGLELKFRRRDGRSLRPATQRSRSILRQRTVPRAPWNWASAPTM